MVNYDPSIIRTFAAKLYDRAQWVVALWVLCLGGLCALNGAVVSSNARFLGALVYGAVGAAIGFLIGQYYAFKLKLQAQMALCQVQVEENTRATAIAATAVHTPREAGSPPPLRSANR